MLRVGFIKRLSIMKQPVQKSLIKPVGIKSLSFMATRPLAMPPSAISINSVSFGEQAFGIMSVKSPTVFVISNKEFKKLKTMWKRFKTS